MQTQLRDSGQRLKDPAFNGTSDIVRIQILNILYGTVNFFTVSMVR